MNTKTILKGIGGVLVVLATLFTISSGAFDVCDRLQILCIPTPEPTNVSITATASSTPIIFVTRPVPLTPPPCLDPRLCLRTTSPTSSPTLTATPSTTPTSSHVTDGSFWTPTRESIVINGLNFSFVTVPTGCFMMGSNAFPNTQPITRICVTEFQIGQTEVSYQQYDQCVRARVCNPPYPECSSASQPTLPVCVTYLEAVEFLEWANEFPKSGYQWCLPTEAQWEYAARAPESLIYPWGNTFEPLLAVYAPTPIQSVNTLPSGASWVGALHMAGNVSEWTSSYYDPNYYQTLQADEYNPLGAITYSTRQAERTIRGGNYRRSDDDVTTFERFHGREGEGEQTTVGFRVARGNCPLE